MKAYYLLALTGATLLSGCAYRSVAYAPVYSPPATVAYVSPTYIAQSGALVLGAGSAA